MRHAGFFVGLVVAGCGGDAVHHLADAPPSPDGPAPIDAAPSPVTLTITNAGAPVAGVHVWFQQADSTLIASTLTDTTGVASAVVAAGAFVTAIDPFPPTNTPDLRTFAGVKPGDHLVLTQAAVAAVFSLTITLPVDAGAATYTLFSSCGSAGLTATGGTGGLPGGLVTLSGCNSSVDLLIETFDPNGGLHKVLFAGSNPVAGNAATIDLSASAYADPANATFAYTNVPAAITTLQLTQLLAGSHGVMISSFGGADVVAGAATIALVVPSGTGAIAIDDTVLRPTSFSRQDVVDWAPFAATYALDLTSQLLPDFTAQPGFDVTNHQATWTEGTGAAPEFSIMQLQVDRPTPVASWTWIVAAPYHAGAVTLPVLPADGVAFNPLASDTVTVFAALSATVPGGYDAVRAGALSNLNPQPTDLVLGGSGRAVVVQFQQLAAAAARHPQRL